ncbi:hypothetical protein ES703_94396 [subsurface metagenome]
MNSLLCNLTTADSKTPANGHCIQTGNRTDKIKMVYGHINQQGMLYFVPESTSKINAHIEINLYLADITNLTASDQMGKCLYFGFVTIVLADDTSAFGIM